MVWVDKRPSCVSPNPPGEGGDTWTRCGQNAALPIPL